MPLYEYECDRCGHLFESIRKFSDPPIAVCPSCGGTVHKLQSAPALQFKGTGWYVTDYAQKDKPAEGTPAGAADPKGSGESGKGDKNDKAAKAEPAAKADASAKTETGSSGGGTAPAASNNSAGPTTKNA